MSLIVVAYTHIICIWELFYGTAFEIERKNAIEILEALGFAIVILFYWISCCSFIGSKRMCNIPLPHDTWYFCSYKNLHCIHAASFNAVVNIPN